MKQRRMRPIRLLAATIAVGLAARADASVLCARRNADEIADGAGVKVRNACKSNELPVDAAALRLAGAPGLVTTVVRTGSQISTNGTLSTAASCAAGEVATGGGALSLPVNGGLPVLRSSRPEPDGAGDTPTGWRSTVVNSAATGTITVTPFVVCAVP